MNAVGYVKMALVGDIALSSSLKRYLEQRHPISRSVINALNKSHFVLGNFEFAMTNEGVAYHGYSREEIVADYDLMQELRRINALKLTLANNHIMDWGLEGLQSTIGALSDMNIPCIGAGQNIGAASEPSIFSISGISFAILAAAKPFCVADSNRPGVRPISEAELCSDIYALKQQGIDHVIVALHWGVEYSRYPSPMDVRLARMLVNSGATLVAGHHPHTLQGVESYENGLIAYSLGNFIMDMNIDLSPDYRSWELAHRSMILEVEFIKSGILSHNIIPVCIDENMRSVFPDEETRSAILKDIKLLSSTISEEAYYKQAYSNLQARTFKAWSKKLREHGASAVLIFFKTLKLRHVKMIGMHYYYRLKQIVTRE